MDKAWLNRKVPADHYRHARPQYLRAPERAHVVAAPAESANDADEQAVAARQETNRRTAVVTRSPAL
jgi:hypothetical protein